MATIVALFPGKALHRFALFYRPYSKGGLAAALFDSGDVLEHRLSFQLVRVVLHAALRGSDRIDEGFHIVTSEEEPARLVECLAALDRCIEPRVQGRIAIERATQTADRAVAV